MELTFIQLKNKEGEDLGVYSSSLPLEKIEEIVSDYSDLIERDEFDSKLEDNGIIRVYLESVSENFLF